MADSSIRPVSLDPGLDDSGLSPDEDNELRQLTWFSLVGHLSDASQARMLELRARDRRTKVRNPRPDPSASRLGTPETPTTVPTPRLAAENQTAPGNFVCPNCGYVQRGPGLG
jgi:hypothetical protein